MVTIEYSVLMALIIAAAFLLERRRSKAKNGVLILTLAATVYWLAAAHAVDKSEYVVSALIGSVLIWLLITALVLLAATAIALVANSVRYLKIRKHGKHLIRHN